MTYELNENGIKIPTLSELLEIKKQEFREIYGADINIEQNSPDGQFINIEAQAETDLGEFIVGVYNSFDPDTATGRELDRVASYKGIQRKGATYTQLNIRLETDRACIVKAGFTIGDSVGNNFLLLNDFACDGAGVYSVLFQAETIGEVTVALNTVNNIVTPVLGVVSVLNNSSPLNVGVNEEDDLSLRARFNQSVALNGDSHIDNLYSRILNLDGVVSCYIDNNRTNETNEYGTPPHSIWVIVSGGTDGDIANAIYSTISDGCGMRGEINYEIVDSQDNIEVINFDRVTTENLYIKFLVYAKTAGTTIDIDKIKTDLVNNLKIETNTVIDKNYINVVLVNNDNKLIYSEIKTSKDNMTWSDFVSNSNLNYQFVLTTDNITIAEE
jgi:uncharacterized phage protein gp47/JayE